MTSNNRAKTGISLSIGGLLMAAAFAGGAQDAMFVDSSGNVGVGTNTPATALHVFRSDGSAEVFVEDTSATASPRVLYRMYNNGAPILNFRNNNASSAPSWTYTVTDGGGFRINASGSGAPVEMDLFDGGNMVIGGTLTEGSSREIKEDIVSVDHETMLAKLEDLEISEWSYRKGAAQRHIGPMAEDFNRVFGLGPDNKHIAPKDLAGVALTAAKALKQENARKDERIEALEARIQRLEALLLNE